MTRTTLAWLGEDKDLTPRWEIQFTNSNGLLYSVFTYYFGFRVNSGKYKVMGLAPYGKAKQVQAIYDHMIDLICAGTKVHRETNPRDYNLLKAFEARTGCGAVINTSFNVRNEPIVCIREDAYHCVMRSAIDILVLENCVVYEVTETSLNYAV